MTRQEALRMVSDKTAAWLSATSAEELLNAEEGEFTAANWKRIEEAMNVVAGRLFRMGGGE